MKKLSIENNNNQNNFKKDKLRRDTELIVLKKIKPINKII